MLNVSILGTGTTTFGRLDAGLKTLGSKAIARALADCDADRAGVDALYVGNFVGGLLDRQGAIGPILAAEVGLTGVPAMTTKGVCASSGIAFRVAYQAIRHGECDVVVAAGVESMTRADTASATRALGSAADMTTECRTGLTFPGFYGLYFDRYAHEYSATREQVVHRDVDESAANAREVRDDILVTVRHEHADEVTTLEAVVGENSANSPPRCHVSPLSVATGRSACFSQARRRSD